MFNFGSKHKKNKDIRVVFAYKNFAAVMNSKISHIGLGVAAQNTTETLNQHGILGDVWGITKPEHLFERLEIAEQCYEKKVTHVVVCAPWIPTATLSELCHKYPNIKFTVVSHSNVAFLMADPSGTRLLREGLVLQQHVKNFQIAGNCNKFAKWATICWGAEVVWLPNLYNIQNIKKPASLTAVDVFNYKPWSDDLSLRIGCFGAVRPLKNAITATATALEICKVLDVPTELWFSGGRVEGGGSILSAIDQLAGNIPNFKIKFKTWAPWHEFREFVGTMHLNLQPSFTESFNMVAADSIHEGIPVVGSDAISWLPQNWIGVSDDANDLARIGLELLHDPMASQKGQDALRAYVKTGYKQWHEYLTRTK